MKKQKYLFLEGEADRWFERNRDRLVKTTEGDPVAAAIRQIGIKPARVLEIGCANGWRLAALRDTYGCDIMGVEPSRQACIAATAQRVPVVQSTASSPAVATPFDLIIYGFCLYLADPADWMRIAAEGDCILQEGGHLIVHDFAATSTPFAQRYSHCDGVFSYHFDFAQLWLSNPLYTLAHRTMVGSEMVTTLKKKSVNSIQGRA